MNDNDYHLYNALKLFHWIIFMNLSNLFLSVLLLVSTVCQATDSLNTEQQLGQLLFEDKQLSINRNQSCASCHSLQPSGGRDRITRLVPGFSDPENTRNGTSVSTGSIQGTQGSLNAPSVGYASFTPAFHWDEAEGLYLGGQFWNGRASTLSDQAKKPFLNPVEMAMPDEWAVMKRIKQQTRYHQLFKDVYGVDLNVITEEQSKTAFDLVAKAISAFEKSSALNKFNSKFDYVLAGKTIFTPLEAKGFELFNREDKGNCASCHISKSTQNEAGETIPPLFTDFTYDNIGLPRNVNIPNNPEPNLGLGGRADIAEVDLDGLELGKHKVMSLRNIALTAPYGHNGVMPTLEEMVHFYNTRDTLGMVLDNKNARFAKTGWPAPEIADNVNQEELGNLNMNVAEEKAIVAFLKTLTDDYPVWGHDRNVPPGTPAPFRVSP
ncbi:MAG: cytochrome-c peroxidase [Methylobacter sp.]